MNQPKQSYLITLLVSIAIVMCAISCERSDKLFVRKPSSYTGITFNNRVVENDSINPIDLEFLYNGGGVAVGDFNGDSLADLYFTASMESNRLYLNQGNLQFRDVTTEARVTGEGRWANAASTVDINNDGLLDIYISNSIMSDSLMRRNLLYINQGTNGDGIPVFKEMAAEYGLADNSYSVHAAFFDYDNDGDLDMYLLTTKLAKREGARLVNNNDRDAAKTDYDKLYRNDWNEKLHHPVYTDVSAESGIVHPGFGLGVAVADINKDGWKDVYVTNDFFGNDLMYMNNGDGTFTDRLSSMFKHTSQNAMGNDIADINNDGLADVIAVDMNPEDNFRKKKNMNGSNYYLYQNMVANGYNIQYVRNTLQLNRGPAVYGEDSMGFPVFSDISFYSGVAETDWSWNPSLADFDNDGWRDLIITNGYPKDVTDHDFAAYRGQMGKIATKDQLIEKIPQIKIRNYAFRNNGRLKFENVSTEWGLGDASFSNGGVYADLDRDGDLDYVINNINEEAFVFENRLNKKGEEPASKLLTIRYAGSANNIQGFGAVTEIFYGDSLYQVHENFPVRGYLSTVEPVSYFGTGAIAVIDSVVVTWPDQRKQVIRNVMSGKELIVQYDSTAHQLKASSPKPDRLFRDVTNSTGVKYIHRESDYIDFNEQRLLLHKLSQYGPGLAAGDVDGNGFDDLFVGGSGNFQGKFLLQNDKGMFREQALPKKEWKDARNPENMGILFFDADGDNDLDVYFANGSTEFRDQPKNLTDQFLVNEGNGTMRWDSLAIPVNQASKSCVKAADFDRDGDLDLFVGGRVKAGNYPEPVSSFIYRNDSRKGEVKFTDVTSEVAPVLTNAGMICDALWSDFNNDGNMDLVLAGEWMPLTFLLNVGGKFKNVTAASGIDKQVGWWNSLAGGDFDNDGDIDYIAGNLGTNSYLRVSEKYPLKLYRYDFDNNNYVDIVPTLYLPDEKGEMKEFPVHTRDDVVEQLPALKKKFLTYKEFAEADVPAIFGATIDSALVLEANYFQSSFIRNDGNGKFTLTALPADFQMAPVYAVVVEDYNSDGFLDVAVSGNDFGNEVANGRYDALNGIVALGDGKGNFNCLTIQESGLFIPGDGKALVKLKGAGAEYLLAATQNQGALKIFEGKNLMEPIKLLQTDRYLLISGDNGLQRRQEVYHGHSYLSQSSLYAWLPKYVTKVFAVNERGEKRLVYSKR